MIGRGTKYEKPSGKDEMGVGQMPNSKSDPMGKGQGPINKTGRDVYANNTGRADKGVV